MAQDLPRWITDANAAMLRTYAIDLNDAGLDSDDLGNLARAYPDPRAFVAWFGARYDLTSFEEVNFGHPRDG
jgi:hypothetical protein